MNALCKTLVAAAGVALATQANAQVRLFEQQGFVGPSFMAEQQVNDLTRFGFNDRASSLEVFGGWWEVCEHADFRGHCVVLRPGRYSNLSRLGLNDRVSSVRAVNHDDSQVFHPATNTGQITFFEHERFLGEAFTADRDLVSFAPYGFNARASSVEVVGDTWQVCDGANFSGNCVTLTPGRYPALVNYGLNDRVVSARVVNRASAAVTPVPAARDLGRVTFFEHENFAGRAFTADREVGNLERFGFNDRAASVEVVGGPWEVCEDGRFRGRCVVLLPGRYPSLAAVGFGNRITSVRAVDLTAAGGTEPRYIASPR